uniref:Uncharacterized protein n=1 Tax=Octactis speculum TaxID=3111310 RepID=A0A7S2DL93_9STRA|mmetsp:Transcript_50554/g.68780  ORF Transcript_50554/g.68780 Transcript_50554/m.68780 type:complete len:241 (+) Transcript_50554:31-753(+)|eukprot:CAMPEP_0185771414 /NCGR_PEP_ID=MMETSP1174-20130828/64291_1 /TAXON_ID=35687 /ORGANISM="Dictyocha speculum, Strain CCMP1381" /LENGTH=240 /DNA_ID=CAMNT_0028457283 /DNA_START=31 /DNA_END=753 /DNA_ORIENTATION=+
MKVFAFFCILSVALGFHGCQHRRRHSTSRAGPFISSRRTKALWAKGFGKEKEVKKKAAPVAPTAQTGRQDVGGAATTGATWPVPGETGEASSSTKNQEERDDDIYKKFGIKGFDESEAAASPFAASSAKRKAVEEELEGVNLLAFVPPGVQIAIEKLLFFSTGTLLTTFIIIGIAITWDAYAISTKNTLPAAIKPVVDAMELQFTNTGIAFLASSSSLGLFKVAQFSNPDIVYSEADEDA